MFKSLISCYWFSRQNNEKVTKSKPPNSLHNATHESLEYKMFVSSALGYCAWLSQGEGASAVARLRTQTPLFRFLSSWRLTIGYTIFLTHNLCQLQSENENSCVGPGMPLIEKQALPMPKYKANINGIQIIYSFNKYLVNKTQEPSPMPGIKLQLVPLTRKFTIFIF